MQIDNKLGSNDWMSFELKLGSAATAEKQSDADPSLSEVSQPPEPAVQGHQFSGNMLSQNFFQQNKEQSKYIQGLLTTFAVENDFRNQVMSIMQSHRDLVEKYGADPMTEGKRAAEETEDYVDGYYSDKEAERMEDEREEDEEKIEQEQEEKIEEKLSGDDNSLVDLDKNVGEALDKKSEEQYETEAEKGNIEATEEVAQEAVETAPENNLEKDIEAAAPSKTGQESPSEAQHSPSPSSQPSIDAYV